MYNIYGFYPENEDAMLIHEMQLNDYIYDYEIENIDFEYEIIGSTKETLKDWIIHD